MQYRNYSAIKRHIAPFKKNKIMNLNYTSICHYCGAIYKSNRSTSKYCCRQHISLYNVNGSQINYNILNNKGGYKNYYEILSRIYNKGKFLTSLRPDSFDHEVLHNHGYDGPLPQDDELLLVSGFLIREVIAPRMPFLYYSVKPMELLTKHEKASCAIITPVMYMLTKDH